MNCLRPRLWIGSLLIAAVFLSSCGQAGVAPQEPVNLSIAGSTEMMPLLVELTGAFSDLHPNVIFSLRGGGSTLGESWVADGQVSLAASTLLTEEDEVPPDLMRVPIGWDGIALLVHRSNPIENLTLLQLRDLYSGRALDWQDVGGESGEVVLVSREDGSGTRALFEDRVMDDETVALTAVVMPTSRDVVDYVADHPDTIGYVSQAYTREAAASMVGVNALAQVHVVPIEDKLPNQETLATQSYHLSRPLFLLRRRADRGWPQQFIDFVLSPAGQEIVERFHVRIR
ncbi:MAG: phosphate ABC transporter substrate-binding protein [Caldilineaceae bacterium]